MRTGGWIRGRVPPGWWFGPAVTLVAVLLFGATATTNDWRGSDPAQPSPPALLVLRPEWSRATNAPIDNLWAVRADGSHLRRVTDEPEGVLEYAADRRGGRIAFVVPDGPTTTAIWVMNLDGGQRQRITPATERARHAELAWHPRGDLLIYVRRESISPDAPGGRAGAAPGAATTGAPKLWVATPDGRPPRRVYGNGEEVGESPVWSPDGVHVAFRELFAQRGLSALVVTDFASPPLRVPSDFVGRVAWSPDGAWLAFAETGAAAGRGTVVVLRADGGGRVVPPPSPEYSDAAPAWSPDGFTLAFLRRPVAPSASDAAIAALWLATRDGQVTRRLFGGDGRATSEPIWSPDGRQIAAARYTVTGTPERDVWLVNADGSQPRAVVRNASRPQWV